jgi:hypothetical protein
MIQGDLIEFANNRWIVGQRRREVRTHVIYSSTGMSAEMPDNADKMGICKVLCNPSKDWPVIIIKSRPGTWGPMSTITDLRTGVALRVMADWVPANVGRVSGNFFVNPNLGLRIGDTLLIRYDNGKTARATIPRTFATVPQKIAKAAEKPHEPRTVFDHLLAEDEDTT